MHAIHLAGRDDNGRTVSRTQRLAIRSTKFVRPYIPLITFNVDNSHREITEKDIDAEMLTNLAGSPPVDVLIRTSGVKRLSDFMLWQVCSLFPLQGKL